MNSDLLGRLCASCGLITAYRDVRGEQQAVPIKTRLALLGAMGWSVASDGDVERALAAREAQAWRRMLPPVQVVRAGSGKLTFSLCVPDAYARTRFEWTLVEESGARRSAALVPAECEPVARCRIAGAGFARFVVGVSEYPKAGYHRIELSAPGREEVPAVTMALIVAPPRCYLPDAVTQGRGWGPMVNLYALRSSRNWGIGDFGDLATLIELSARHGASMVGVNPLHALFPHDPDHASPYSPSSRTLLNVLYLDVEALPDFAESAAARERVAAFEFQAELRALRAASLIDYRRVAKLKFQVLERLYAHFREHHLEHESARARAFRAFQHAGGEALRLGSLFYALQETLYAADATRWGWRSWPDEYRDPRSAAVGAFASDHGQRLEYWDYLQWNATRQLEAAGARSLARHLGVGIYQDLAVGADPGGAETWAQQELYAANVTVGCPPDEFNMKGQDWGIVPAAPERLTQAAYAPFVALLRANMRHAGALRIDHVMGLVRLYWIPAGEQPDRGGYVSYPVDDLLGVLALESERNQCLVIGEDLGTLPEGLAERLRAENILSYRLLYFERAGNGAFCPPQRYPEHALAAIGTHDLPTLRGFWLGHDLDLRTLLDLYPDEELRRRSLVDRAQARAELLIALERENLLPPGTNVHPRSVPEVTPGFVLAVHRFLARSACRLLAVQPENVFGELEQVNLPATTTQYPNWRHRLSLDLEAWETDSRFAAVSAVLQAERRPARTPERKRTFATRIPDATYRLQFNREFTFEDATALVPYLHELGVSHVYASPYFSARPGSLHGYDIVDHNAFNSEIGSAEHFERLVAVLQAHGMGQVLDMVPNHMGVMGSDNLWWLEVLENGPASAFAAYFDIDWQVGQPELQQKLLVPVLGDHYGVILERGELRLQFDLEAGAFSVFYHAHRFPIDPAEYPRILAFQPELLARRTVDSTRLAEFQALIAAFGHLPPRNAGDPGATLERQRDKEVHKRRLAQLCRASSALVAHIADAVNKFNGEPGHLASFDALDQLLDRQAYRLAYWRVASDEINYRRFFDINDLAALRMEDERVFEATHRLALRLLEEGKIDGLRIDHPDGLYDPARYFSRLQEHFASNMAPVTGPARPVYLVLEKILADHERLPEHWPVHGTTGYRFANVVSGLFVDASAEAHFDRIYNAFIRERVDYADLLHQCRLAVMKSALSSELTVLANRACRIARADRHTRDFTLNALRDALAAIVACFPVYRTYISGRPGDADRRYIEWASGAAHKRAAAPEPSTLEFLHALLMGTAAAGSDERGREILDFVMRFQQFTSVVAAKGMEDTAFYRYNRLVSLNEVGGNPLCFGISLPAFHRASADRARHWPHTMLSTSTHDSKRSEDVRARIGALSQYPAEWWTHVQRWRRLNRDRKRQVRGRRAPSANDEYLIYQTLIGTWPLEDPDTDALTVYRERIRRYCVKAAREAKVNTGWVNPDSEYEAALEAFVSELLTTPERNAFLADFIPFARRIARTGILDSLAQLAIKIASPGVPDFYQGSELWQFQLVDPDNRAAVDYDIRRRLLDELRTAFDCPADETPSRARDLLARMEDGRVKLFVTWKALAARRSHRALFARGTYLPLEAKGTHAQRLCAFARGGGESAAVLVTPRLAAGLADASGRPVLGREPWRDTRVNLPVELAGAYRNVFTSEIVASDETATLAAGEVFANFPVALLLRERRA